MYRHQDCEPIGECENEIYLLIKVLAVIFDFQYGGHSSCGVRVAPIIT